ncbi:hypothetical protein JTM50_36535, partial [Pseudomonas aeruginosa]|nr:hypothetical protein [Pseudomonas aeruginosa]
RGGTVGEDHLGDELTVQLHEVAGLQIALKDFTGHRVGGQLDLRGPDRRSDVLRQPLVVGDVDGGGLSALQATVLQTVARERLRCIGAFGGHMQGQDR